MSTPAFIVAISTAGWIISIIGILIAIAIAVSLERRSRAQKRIEHDRLTGEASAHREQADSNVARARELGREADEHRSEAERHAVAADEHTAAAQEHAEKASALENQVRTAGQSAARHDEQAADREQKLG